eukprot:GILJ01000425.1.p1 GENE.GILJ01000425.1~~GILJ01000425.1.p1  ORF type:complete len:214 (-),score=20.34 GILJ01000425.1:287-928(-)
MSQSSYDYLLKVLIVGDAAVGKSSLMLRYAEDSFSGHHTSTIGIDFKVVTSSHEGKVVKLQVWDTAGHERFRTISTSYYRGAHGALVVFDRSNRDSFEHVPKWVEEIRRHAGPDIVIGLVENKCDIADSKVDSTEVTELMHSLHLDFALATSAKTNFNVAEVFKEMIASMVNHHIYKLSGGVKGEQGGRQGSEVQLSEGVSLTQSLTSCCVIS